jgi:hypothetical protein
MTCGSFVDQVFIGQSLAAAGWNVVHVLMELQWTVRPAQETSWIAE